MEEINQEELDQEIEVTEEIEQQVEDAQSKNMREMRLSKERAEKERDEAYKLMQEMKNRLDQESYQPPDFEEEEDFGVGDEDLVEGKHVKQLKRELKKIREEMNSYKNETLHSTAETKVKQKYSDFDSVVSKSNVEELVRQYPEIGATLRSNPDLYSQAVTAYTMIKNLGIYKEDVYKSDRDKAIENMNKPRPLASVSPQQGDSPLSRANAFAGGLTDELKAQLYKEMMEARSRR